MDNYTHIKHCNECNEERVIFRGDCLWCFEKTMVNYKAGDEKKIDNLLRQEEVSIFKRWQNYVSYLPTRNSEERTYKKGIEEAIDSFIEGEMQDYREQSDGVDLY